MNLKRGKWHIILRDSLLYSVLLITGLLLYALYQYEIYTPVMQPQFFLAYAKAIGYLTLFIFFVRTTIPIWKTLPNQFQTIAEESAVPVLFIGLTLYHYGLLFLCEFPTTFDHTTQLLRAFITEKAILHEGTVLPWTSAIGAGIPLNDLYPPGYALLGFAIRCITFFTINIYTAYTTSIFLCWFILLGSIYTAARVWFGKTAGFIALFFLYFDPGVNGLSGWQECFSMGMGAMTLSHGFWIFSILCFSSILQQEKPKKITIVLTSFCVMASILSHSIALISIVVACSIISVCHVINSSHQNKDKLYWAWITVIIGYGLSIWWWLPFALSKEWVLPFGTAVQSSEMLGHHLLHTSLFPNTPPIFFAFGLVAAIWGFTNKNHITIALSLIFWVFLITNQNVFYSWFYSPTFSKIMEHIPLFRLSVYSKLCVFLLTGALLQSIGFRALQLLYGVNSWFKPEPSTLLSVNKKVIQILFLALLLTPFLHLSQILTCNYRQEFSGQEKYPLQHSAEFLDIAADFDKTLQTLPSKQSNTREPFLLPFCVEKIGIQSSQIAAVIPIQYGYGIVPSPYMPTMMFTNRSMNFEPYNPPYASMKYSLAYGDTALMFQAVAQTNVIQKNGLITLLEQQWYPNHIPIFWVQPNDAVIDFKVQSYGYVKINISGLANEEWLRTGISRYRKWNAYLNGEEIPIHEYYAKGEPNDAGKYCSVLINNGTLEFRYEPEWFDWLSYILSYLSIFILICILIWHMLFLQGILTVIDLFWKQLVSITVITSPSIVWLLLIWLLLLKQPQPSIMWYAGLMKNRVGTFEHAPDQFLDLEFGLFIGKEHLNKTICEIILSEKKPAPFPPSFNVWSNEDQHWKYLLVDSIGNNRFVYKHIPETHITIENPQSFEIYIGNPYTNFKALSQGNYIPSGFLIECTIHFTDGSFFKTSTHPGPQGHKELN